jgi:hypothetical protein
MVVQLQMYSDHPEAFAQPGNRDSRGEHFFEEALHLLELDEENLNLTAVEARGDLYLWSVYSLFTLDKILIKNGRACAMGKERSGCPQLVEVTAYFRSMFMKRDTFIKMAGFQSQEMTRAIDIAIRGLFNLTS